MRKHAAVLILSFLGLALLAGGAGWLVFTGAGGRSETVASVWVYLLGGALAVGLFGTMFVFLAVHAADSGFDERIEPD